MDHTGGSAGSASAHDNGATLEDAISASLEKQKFRLLTQVAQNKKAKSEVEARIVDAEQKIAESRQRLGEYNALFMSIEDAGAKAPKQRLGAAQAVLGTKKIIERELTKLFKDSAVTEMKLNKQKDRNSQSKAHVDQLRKEHVTFKKLFVSMADELNAVKGRIAATKKAVNEAYAQRDRAQEDMRELARQFELDKLERQQEWALFSEAIERANKEGVPEHMAEGTGQLTQEQEQALRLKIKKGQQKMAKDRAALIHAQHKHAAYSEALTHIKAATGYDAVDDIVSTFDKYEDEKFQKVQAANRMVREIEALEKQVGSTRHEVQRNDAVSTAIKVSRVGEREALEREAHELEAALSQQQEELQFMLAEVQALYPVVEFAFNAIGCHMAFDQGSALDSSTVGGRQGGPSSPIRSKTAALKMYNESALMRMEVQSGVNANSLVDFVGIIENHAADLIQQYAALVSSGEMRGGSAQLDLSRKLAPSTLGPSKPSGKLKESVTTSALVAALAVDAGKMDTGSMVDESVADDDARPLTMAELKRQAAAQMGSDKNLKLVRTAASTAANVLTRLGGAAPQA